MPDVRQTDFAQMCRVSEAYLSMNKKRGKVILNDKGLIDTLNEKNAAFLAKCQSRQEAKNIPEEASGERPAKTKEKKKVVAVQLDMDTYFEIEKQKKVVDLEKAKADLELKGMQVDKFRGDVIPTDIVKQALSQIFASLSTGFKQAADNWLIEIAKKVGLNRNDQAELRGQLIRIVNESIDKAVNEAKSSVANIVSEYRSDT